MGFFNLTKSVYPFYLKTVIIMAKIDLKFLDFYDNCTIKAFKVPDEKICIEIDDPCEKILLSVFLDKSTAIKFAKTLRTEINKITEVCQ